VRPPIGPLRRRTPTIARPGCGGCISCEPPARSNRDTSSRCARQECRDREANGSRCLLPRPQCSFGAVRRFGRVDDPGKQEFSTDLRRWCRVPLDGSAQADAPPSQRVVAIDVRRFPDHEQRLIAEARGREFATCSGGGSSSLVASEQASTANSQPARTAGSRPDLCNWPGRSRPPPPVAAGSPPPPTPLAGPGMRRASSAQ
jgi:hypothetical protein